MNVFIGVISKNSSIINSFQRYVRDHYGHEVRKIVTNSGLELSYSDTHQTQKIITVVQKNGVTLLLNGYIYLPLSGWSGDSSPMDDQEITAKFLLDKYFKEGDKFIEDIYGHFSIVVDDPDRNSVFLARDPSGQNDLFVFNKDRDIVFSNKLNSIAGSIGGLAELDRSYEDFLLVYGFYPMGKTVYKHTESVPAKSLLYLNKEGVVKEQKIEYKKIGTANDLKDQKELIDELYRALDSTIKDILPSKYEKVAVLLGGFDSALVVALLKKQGFDVETFSFFYDDKRFNQSHTDTLAKFLGVKHNWIKVDENIISNGVKNFSSAFNQPTNWPSYVIQTAYLCEAISERGFKYCYTGDGCDYLFYGYPITYKRAKVMSIVGLIPNTLLKVLIKSTEWQWLERALGRPYQVYLGLLRSAQRKKQERTFLTFRIFDDLSLKQLRKGSSTRQNQKKPEAVVSQLASSLRGMSPVKLAYEGKKQVSPNRNKLNGSADISGLAIASPYMHPRIKSFMESVPDELLRPENADTANGKYILSKMAEEKKLLPKEIIYQAKIGAADSPIESWYQGPLRQDVYDQLKYLPFNSNKRYIDSLINKTKAEDIYSKLISKDTKSLVTMSHCISLLITYASFSKKTQSKLITHAKQ